MTGAATTRWSLVLAARGANAASREALGELCENYRPVILEFFRRQDDPQRAEDRTQAFLLHFLESGLHVRADASRGSFRAFLFTAVRNHWHEARRREAARTASGRRCSARPIASMSRASHRWDGNRASPRRRG